MRKSRRDSLIQIVVPLALMAYGWLVFLPFAPPGIPDGSLEWGWTEALADAWIRGSVFGRDIIFTYGPYGFAQGYYLHPGVLYQRLGIRAAMTGLFVGLMWRISRKSGIPSWHAAVAIFIGLQVQFVPDIWAVQANAILWLGVFHAWSQIATPDAGDSKKVAPLDLWLFIGWAAMAPLMMWVKFTVCVLGLPAMVGAALLWARQSPRIALVGTSVFLLGLPFWWVLAGQPLDAIPEYVAWSIELSTGYPDAMVHPASPRALLAAVADVAILFALTRFALGSTDRLAKAIVQWFTAFLLAIAYRSSIIRHWGLGLGLLLAMMGPFLMMLSWRCLNTQRPSRFCARAAIIGMGVLGVWACNVAVVGIVERNVFTYFAAPFSTIPQRLSLLLQCTRLREIADAQFRSRRPDVANLLHLPHPRDLTADLLNSEIPMVIGQQFKYRPRPIFQSYTVLTPGEARLNADFFRGDQAPDLVFYDSSVIDSRFPMLDDNASWPVLLERYSPVAVVEDCLVATKRPHPLTMTQSHETTADRRFGDWIELAPLLEHGPDAGPIWCSIDYRPSMAGRLYGLGVQPVFGGIEVRLADGQIDEYRLVLQSAKGGFILSPMLGNRASSLRFWHDPMAPPPKSRRVVAIRVCAWHECDWAFEPAITIHISRLNFSDGEASTRPTTLIK